MTAGPSRAGRHNAAYAAVPLRLARECPKCGAGRGRLCGRWQGAQWLTNKAIHAERRKPRKDQIDG